MQYIQEGELNPYTQMMGPGATGHILKIGGKIIAIDRGTGLGNKDRGEDNYYPVVTENSQKVDLILVTHCHLDHCGYIPALAAMNPEAKIIMTRPTALGALIMWEDSLKIHRSEERKRASQIDNETQQLIYDKEDIFDTLKRTKVIPRPGWWEVFPGLWFGFYPSGHTRGAMMTFILDESSHLVVMITGDISSHDQPLTKGVMLPPKDFFGDCLKGKKMVLVSETTYGNREAEKPMTEIYRALQNWVKKRIEERHPILAPSFATRGPDLLKLFTDAGIASHVDGMVRDFCYIADETWSEQDIPLNLKKLIDSKLAFIYEKIDRRHTREKWEDEEIHKTNTALGYCCGLPNPSPIISSSAMMDQGASVRHAYEILPNRNAGLVFTGYVFPHSTGAEILNVKKGETVKLRKWDPATKTETMKPVPVSCEVAHFALSGHDQASALAERVRLLNEICPIEAVIGHHGDDANFAGFEKRVKNFGLGIPVIRGAHMKEIEI